MRVALIAILGAATLTVAATPATAQPAADRADVRCLLVMQLAARDPNARDMAARGAHYYMGRLAARGAPARLEPLMVGEARSITSAAQAKTELDRCAGELNQNQTQFQALNQKLAASAPRPAAAPAPKAK